MYLNHNHAALVSGQNNGAAVLLPVLEAGLVHIIASNLDSLQSAVRRAGPNLGKTIKAKRRVKRNSERY